MDIDVDAITLDRTNDRSIARVKLFFFFVIRSVRQRQALAVV